MADDSQTTTLADLELWFSAERMSTYVRSAEAVGCNPVDLYVWDARMSKALLEDNVRSLSLTLIR